MGKKRNTSKVSLALPVTSVAGAGKGGSICGRETGRELSDVSDLESVYTTSAMGDFDEIDDENDLTNLVDSFGDLIENAQDKRVETRLRAIDNINLVLIKNYMPEKLDKWRGTIVDIVERNLKRTPEEALRVCSLAVLFSLQLGIAFEEEICEIIRLMRQICTDEFASEAVRSSCTQAIGLCVYLSVESQIHRYESMQSLKNVWSSMKAGRSTGTSLFSSALSAWVLLLELFEPSLISQQIAEMQPKICVYLESQTVEARISAGEALAIMQEIAVKNIDPHFQFRNQNYLECLLSQLAIDSSKNRAKRDKKLQKLSFRQITDAICNNKWPQMTIRFNKRETLDIDGCHSRLLYDSICQLLRGDMNNHLTKNNVLRELFDLGSILEELDEPSNATNNKAQKIDRLIQFGEQKKKMNINRSKGRANKNDHKHEFIDD